MSSTPQPAPHSRPAPVLILFLLFPLFGILAAGILALNEQRAVSLPPTPLPAPTIAPLPTARPILDQPAAAFELERLGGGTERLSAYRGRVVFLNFWATWCEPCQRELPAFAAFAAEAGDTGPVILAVNVGEPAEQITTYLTDSGIDGLTVLLDTRLDVYTTYEVQVMPTTYVIDARGVVRARHLGELTLEALRQYVAEVG